MQNEAKHPVKTSQKTIRLLSVLQELGSAGVTELASAAGMNKSTVHNHLSTLKTEDLVTQDGSEYTLGLRLLEFGSQARNQQPLYGVAMPEVERLADQTGELANLVVEEYGHGVYLICEQGDDAVDLDIYPGVRRSLHLTASGKAILAHLPEERVEKIIDTHGLPAKTEQSITDRKELLEHLETVRERGFAVDDEEHISGLRCIGTPIFGEGGDVLGAVSVSVPVTRMSDKRFHKEIPDSVRSATNVIELQVQNS